MKPKKIGRPKVAAKDKREVYPIRISAKERTQFESAATRAEQRLPEWIRTTLTAEAAKTEDRSS